MLVPSAEEATRSALEEQPVGQTPETSGFKVKVACRVRPPIKRDLVSDYQVAVTVDYNTNYVAVGDKKRFQFDRVFDTERQPSISL